MFRTATGLKLVHVPYKGAAAALLDTIAGRADLLFASYISAKPYIDDGRLRVLGFSSARRSPLLPDVPTMNEAGIPGVELDFWFGMFAPVGTPKAIVDKLNFEFRRALAEPELKQMIEGQAADITSLSALEFSEMLATEGRRLVEIIKKTNMNSQ